MTPNTQGASWERDFDEKFITSGAPDWWQTIEDGYEETTTPSRVKDFIRTLLSKERAEGERRLLELADEEEKMWQGESSKLGVGLRNFIRKARTLSPDSTEI